MNIKSPVVSATALKSLKSGGVSHNVKIQPIRAGQGKPGGVLGRPVSLSAQRCWKERGQRWSLFFPVARFIAELPTLPAAFL